MILVPYSLEHLNLSENNFVCLLKSIIQLQNLKNMMLNYSTRRILPKFPLNIIYINAVEPSLYLGINDRKLKALGKGVFSRVMMCLYVRITFPLSLVCLFLKKKKKNHISPLRLIKFSGQFLFIYLYKIEIPV